MAGTITVSSQAAAEASVWTDADWEVSFTISDAPTLIPTACDTSDGCGSSCPSACGGGSKAS
ncbi:MAG: FxLD family lanthipeptide [Pseudonocardiaceae bacterium]